VTDIAVMRGTSGETPLILVVEDEETLREPLAHLLRLRHYEVITADSVESALGLLQTNKPDGAIVDLQLNGESGRDVIVRMPSRAPVIIFSGMRSASGELERLRPRTRLIEKPASLTWLIDALDEMLVKTREFVS
jgi:DNA-binding response OmpR family regulator